MTRVYAGGVTGEVNGTEAESAAAARRGRGRAGRLTAGPGKVADGELKTVRCRRIGRGATIRDSGFGIRMRDSGFGIRDSGFGIRDQG
jgi:hypothetical protein